MGKTKKYIIAAVILVCTLIFAYMASNGFHGITKDNENTQIAIVEGMNGTQIIRLLHQSGIIENEVFFKVALKLSGQSGNFKIGVYELNPKMSYFDIINTLTSFSSEGLIKITVPEGYRLSQIAELVEDKGLCDKDELIEEAYSGNFDYAFLPETYSTAEERLEGYLFPDTYLFNENTDANAVLKAMLDEFEDVFNETLDEKLKKSGKNLRETVIMASIIEKEGKESEFKTISSVFYNRLKKNMRLESCATVNYILNKPKDLLSVEDTYIDSPYNTYRNGGLPPSPICSPGLAALEAALFPADTDYLYFVADGNGNNLFSETYEDHLEKKGKLKNGG